MNEQFQDIYRPSQAESARQAFVGALKAQLSGVVEPLLQQRFERQLAPAYQAAFDHPPRDRLEAVAAMEADRLYQTWASLTYTSQDLMWESVGDTVDRVIGRLCARAEILEGNDALGSLQLDPNLVLPEPIASTEIHRQPGGYFLNQADADLTAAALYVGTVILYTAAKGMVDGDQTFSKVGVGAARMIDGQLAALWTDAKNPASTSLEPRSILDMGCGPGTITLGLKQHFGQAEVHGVDLSAPFVRFAHLWAADSRVPIHYRQADAAATGYADESFDLIVSQILLHETWHDKAPAIFAEAKRLLKPGGTMINIDVPYQPDRISLAEQATNHWQVKQNGEPFWTGFADASITAMLNSAGFDDEACFERYVPVGPRREYLVFGAKKLEGSHA